MEQNDYTSLNARNNGYTTLNCLLTARGLGKDVYIVGCNIVGKARNTDGTCCDQLHCCLLEILSSQQDGL